MSITGVGRNSNQGHSCKSFHFLLDIACVVALNAGRYTNFPDAMYNSF